MLENVLSIFYVVCSLKHYYANEFKKRERSVYMNQKKLSLFGFFALTASMVLTVYEYPTFATSKLHLVFFLLLGGILWFLPVALCAAEM